MNLNSNKSVQGGGSGEGFEDPYHITCENADRKKRTVDVINQSINSIVNTNRLFCDEGNNDRDIWLQALRLHCQHHLQEENGNVIKNKSRDRAETRTTTSKLQNQQTATEKDSDKVSISIPGICQFIPKLPRHPTEAVQLWYYGDPPKCFRPVHLFSTSQSRSSIIHNYTHKMWCSSGQKRAYQRFKRIISEIGRHSSNNNAVQIDLVNYRKDFWTKAITNFQNHWEKDGNLKPLSVIEKSI